MEKPNNYSEPVKVYEDGDSNDTKERVDVEEGSYMKSYHQLGFWTRMGCTPESFKRRTQADKSNQLNQTLKPRHLHMIAIGGSIVSMASWKLVLYQLPKTRMCSSW